MLLAVWLVAGWSVALSAQSDNTAVNKRDRDPQSVTAGAQSNARADLDTTRRIRRALVADKSLSTYAHNIKVITSNGTVTLKGPVRTADEKKAVESIAAGVAGSTNVVNQLSVAPPKKSS